VTADAPLTAASMVRWLSEASRLLHEARDELTELDAARGDADHGVNMDRGFQAVVTALTEENFDSPQAVLRRASAVLRRAMGGTSGPLWSAGLRAMSLTLGDGARVDGRMIAPALVAAAEAISALGGAQEGDNTMLDVLFPAGRELTRQLDEGTPLDAALQRTGVVAGDLARGTADRGATRGRASYLGDRAIGSADPGATSAALVVIALRAGLRAT
jgi:phosphoenolpyruvate---glycerone phosphotransferase subunit DhaL